MNRLLDKNSLQAVERFSELKARLTGREFQPIMDQLETVMNALEFKAAKMHLGTIVEMLD